MLLFVEKKKTCRQIEIMRIFPGIFVAFDALTFTVSAPFTGALGANAVALPGLPTTLNYLAGCLGWGECGECGTTKDSLGKLGNPF